MAYNYQFSGDIKGTRIVKDGTYTYSKNKGYNEPKVAEEFSYYIDAMVDSTNGRAVEKLYSDSSKAQILGVSAVDFENSRHMNVEYENDKGVCRVTQFMSTLMD